MTNFNATPPLTTKAYNDILDKHVNEHVIKRSVEKTGKIATDYIQETYTVELRNAGIQTETLDQIFTDYTNQIEELNK